VGAAEGQRGARDAADGFPHDVLRAIERGGRQAALAQRLEGDCVAEEADPCPAPPPEGPTQVCSISTLKLVVTYGCPTNVQVPAAMFPPPIINRMPVIAMVLLQVPDPVT
jgi:hypothetical protein